MFEKKVREDKENIYGSLSQINVAEERTVLQPLTVQLDRHLALYHASSIVGRMSDFDQNLASVFVVWDVLKLEVENTTSVQSSISESFCSSWPTQTPQEVVKSTAVPVRQVSVQIPKAV